jgi:RNA-directed DNA polymerase
MQKRDDKALRCRPEGEAKLQAATPVNAISASLTPPTGEPVQLELFPGRACPLKAKPATARNKADETPRRRDGVQGGGMQRQKPKITGETLVGPGEPASLLGSRGREAHKGDPRKRRPDASEGVGGGRNTDEGRDNRLEGRAATSVVRSKQGKAAGLPPRGKAPHRQKSARPKPRLDSARKLQRTLYRAAKAEPGRRFTLLYDKVCRADVLKEAWRRVARNGGSAGVDAVTIAAVREYGEARFLDELRDTLSKRTYRVENVRRVRIPKPGRPGETRPLGIPTVMDRVVQMAVKLVIEPLFEADFLPCSYGFRPQCTPRMALSSIVAALKAGKTHIVDVDLKAYFDTIDHAKLMALVERRVGDVQVLRLLRAWLKAGVLEDGKVMHPLRGTPQGGVISPLLANIFLHEVDQQWSGETSPKGSVVLVRYADDLVLLAPNAAKAEQVWTRLSAQVKSLGLCLNEAKSKLTTAETGFCFLGFEFRRRRRRVYLWPRAKAVGQIAERVRTAVRSVPSVQNLDVLIGKLNPILNGWCTYFRVGHSNRVFHKVDWQVRDQVQLWLRRKHQIPWSTAKQRWSYHLLHGQHRLYRMVGKVSHLPILDCTPAAEHGRRAVCGKSASTVR